MPQSLDKRYPRVSYLLAAYLVGDDSFETEIDELAATEGLELARQVLGELERLLVDSAVDDDELTSFVRGSSRWLDQTGRITLEKVAARLELTLGEA